MRSEKIWYCKIGGFTEGELPSSCDLPMRQAIQEAYYKITGVWPEFTFSGWSAELTEGERKVAYRGGNK
jgi:hypothetical protein